MQVIRWRHGDRYAALLPVQGRVLGTELPDTLTDRENFAYRTRQAVAPE